ncbi:helicase-related protein [Nocardiopsis metallicus]|uniref:Helicase C-terminal domain-containing protein n=1 Tax=Nocardiopsis metallicus TaxID=179819 RepID=A0A840W959_9ACTN|nr:helicase-related protein [Nocardiopsis metallicus]MBB5489591.1 hypothetical protein [Nocardiopsis metallicus]
MSDRSTPQDETAARQLLVSALRRQLVGPAEGAHEVLSVPPDRRYLMGTLYPQEADLHSRLLAAGEEADSDGAEPANEENVFADDPTSDANAWLPSSLGLSLFTDAPSLSVVCRGSRYVTERAAGTRNWSRLPLPDETVRAFESADIPVLEGHALLRVRRRNYAGASLVTIALVNAAVAEPLDSAEATGRPARTDWDRMLFQASFSVEPLGGTFLEYPNVLLTSRDPEEEELRLQYRHVRTFSIGHGCAVEEQRSDPTAENGPPDRISTEVMPTEEVLRVRHSGRTDTRALKLSFLSDSSVPAPELASELSDFIRGYRNWYEERVKEAAAQVPPWGREAAARILERISTAIDRMEAGTRLMCADPVALTAFRFANQAMALQIRHSSKDLAGAPRTRHDPLPQDTGPEGTYSWRPFQLGFFLLCASGLVDPAHPDREVADVIWFPTGGGKTEAYLLLSCFEMIMRRLRHGPRGGGTAVLSRYTLSLLTTQQFQRAATTVCALEYLRQSAEGQPAPGANLGTEPFSIGLWVGEATTPNTYDRAHELARQQREAAQPTDAFVLDRCPWCGTRIMPANKSSDHGDYGVRTSPSSFSFYCPRDDCRFHEELPVRVVDTHLYDRPPSFLLGTVDKFARLAWEPRAGLLFGKVGQLRPSLVIQDELHLLTGPLGTTVGLYESAILQLCSWSGVAPKVVASTATIRRSGEQVRRMYGRDVQLFPPPGLDARHSYFAEPDEDSPGRLYAGVMAQGHTAGRATVATAAALLHESARLPEQHRDDYWTLVAYHHSLRELGRTLTAARDDIPAQLMGMGGDGQGTRELTEPSVQELTSNLDREEQPRLLARLDEGWPSASAVSFLACTNMLSVGVDIDRLALMLMLGQPKAAAEYIQATSRVGRDVVPGLIVSFFNTTKPRDRSHYETFEVFHRSLYRHVEPSSVTPWSIPSRKRALHAALVILVRHGHGWSAEDGASLILDRPEVVSDAVARIVSWVERADPVAAPEAAAELKELVDDWNDAAAAARQARAKLYWSGQGRSTRHVLKNFDRRNGLWETLHSVRSVDRECQITVKGARP